MLTPEAFLAFYPQFSSFAQGVVLPEYLRQANARFSDFGEDADEARRLYTAHKLTLYSASCLPEGVTTPTKSQIASAGKGNRVKKSRRRFHLLRYVDLDVQRQFHRPQRSEPDRLRPPAPQPAPPLRLRAVYSVKGYQSNYRCFPC